MHIAVAKRALADINVLWFHRAWLFILFTKLDAQLREMASHNPTDGSGLDFAGISQLLDPNAGALLQQTGTRPLGKGKGNTNIIITLKNDM